MIAQKQKELASKGNKSPSGNSSYTSKDKDKDKDKSKDKDEDNIEYTGTPSGADEGDGSVIGLGIGPVSDDVLEKLAKAGAIVGDESGNLYWADGWNRTNYEQRLKDFSGWGNFLTLPML